MSLFVQETSKVNIPLLEAGAYPAVCNMLVDLGDQYSEQFKTTQRKVLISWEIPSEKLDNGETRRMSNTYTASLNSKGNLRKDLISWRGRDFTVEELKRFDLRNIVGAPCLLNIIHKESADGNKRAVIGGIMKLPKGMPVPALSNGFTIFDMDEPGADEKMAELPEWIQTRIKESETWKEREAAIEEREAIQNEDAAPEPEAVSMDIDGAEGQLPF